MEGVTGRFLSQGTKKKVRDTFSSGEGWREGLHYRQGILGPLDRVRFPAKSPLFVFLNEKEKVTRDQFRTLSVSCVISNLKREGV